MTCQRLARQHKDLSTGWRRIVRAFYRRRPGALIAHAIALTPRLKAARRAPARILPASLAPSVPASTVAPAKAAALLAIARLLSPRHLFKRWLRRCIEISSFTAKVFRLACAFSTLRSCALLLRLATPVPAAASASTASTPAASTFRIHLSFAGGPAFIRTYLRIRRLRVGRLSKLALGRAVFLPLRAVSAAIPIPVPPAASSSTTTIPPTALPTAF